MGAQDVVHQDTQPASSMLNGSAASPLPMLDVAGMASTPVLQRMVAALARQAAR